MVPSATAKSIAAECSTPIRLISRALTEGKLAFFLGCYAHLRNVPRGNEFYWSLAEKFDCPNLAGDKAAVAAFVAKLVS